jgi:hypothetical protein
LITDAAFIHPDPGYAKADKLEKMKSQNKENQILDPEKGGQI